MRKGDEVLTVNAGTKYLLWGRAAGHCEICHRSLEEDGAYRMSGNFSNIAHIRAQSPDGPRYDERQTDKERDGGDNLLLLCPTCHKNIDVDNRDEFPVERLQSIKIEREDAIKKYVSLSSIPKLNVVTYVYPIRGEVVSIKDTEWKAALLDFGATYATPRAFAIAGDAEKECPNDGFQQAATRMETRVKKYRETIEEPEFPIGVFAMAPQPLLIKLGILLSDKQSVIPFQWHRNESSWSFRDKSSGADYGFRYITGGNESASDIALALSLSANINVATLPEKVAELPLVELFAKEPNVEVVSSIDDLTYFGDVVVSAISNIHSCYPKVERIHVFPAAPVSLAVKFGMAVNRNLFKEMVIYEKKDGTFSEALRLR